MAWVHIKQMKQRINLSINQYVVEDLFQEVYRKDLILNY